MAVDRDGLIADRLPDRTTSLLYLTPSHQYPTGGTLSADRRGEIIAWARRYGCYVLETITIATSATRARSAAVARRARCTIYLGTFSNPWAADRSGHGGVRADCRGCPVRKMSGSAMALPGSNKPRLPISCGPAAIPRICCGSARTTRKTATIWSTRYGAISATSWSRAARADCTWSGIRRRVFRTRRRSRRPRCARGSESILCGRPRSCSRQTALTGRAILLGYAALSRKQIEKGIARLSDAIDDAIDDPATDMTAYFLQQSTCRAAAFRPTRHRECWHPDFASNRLYAGRRFIVHSRRGTPHDKVTHHAGLEEYLSLSDQGIERTAADPRRTGSRKPFPTTASSPWCGRRAVRHQEPRWGKKGLFVMLMLEEALARVWTALDVETLQLTITQDNHQLMIADLSDATRAPGSRNSSGNWFRRFAGAGAGARADGHFMDKPDNVISLINLATVRSLEEQWGFKIDPLRFRANFYIDGARPWEEFDWVGSDIRIGDGLFRVDRRNGRCGATNVNPETGRRDLICRRRCAPPSGTRNSASILSPGRGRSGSRRFSFRSTDSAGNPVARPLALLGLRAATLYLRRMLFRL